jgi:hypothetical protein
VSRDDADNVAMSEFRVSDEIELLALLHALMEAKLAVVPRDRDVSASRIVARLAHLAFDAESAATTVGIGRRQWIMLTPRHADWRAIVSRALLDADILRKATHELRVDYVRQLIAPYRPSDENFAALVDEIETLLETCAFYELWHRTGRPHGGDTLIVRDRRDGSKFVQDQERNELFTTANHPELWEWLHERGFYPVGRFVDADVCSSDG